MWKGVNKIEIGGESIKYRFKNMLRSNRNVVDCNLLDIFNVCDSLDSIGNYLTYFEHKFFKQKKPSDSYASLMDMDEETLHEVDAKIELEEIEQGKEFGEGSKPLPPNLRRDKKVDV